MDYNSSTKEEIERMINDRINDLYGYNVQFVYSYGGSYSLHTSITVRVLFKIHGVTFLFLKKKYHFKLIDDDQYYDIIKYVLGTYIWNAIIGGMDEYHKYSIEWTDANGVVHKTPFIAKDQDDLNSKFMFGSKATGEIKFNSSALIY